MWFAFGTLTLAISIGFEWHRRWHREWHGEIKTLGWTAYEFDPVHIRGLLRGAKVGVAVPKALGFELKRESVLDRFFKWSGLTVEMQIGQAEFDALVDVASNDDQLAKHFMSSASLQGCAQSLLQLKLQGCRVRSVRCAKGKLWLDLRMKGLSGIWSAQKLLDEAISALLPSLSAMAVELNDKAQGLPLAARDRFLLPAAVIMSVSSGMFINGFFGSLRLEDGLNLFTIDATKVLFMAAGVASIVVMLLVFATFVFLGRTARAHLVLLEVLLVGSIGAFATAEIEVKNANKDWDSSSPERVASLIQKKVTTDTRRKVHYLVTISDWSHPSKTHEISVTKAMYDQCQVGQVLNLDLKAGFLGAKWARIVASQAIARNPSGVT